MEFVRSAGGRLDVPGRRGHGMSGEKEVVKKISASDGSFPDSRVRSFIGGEVCMMCVKGSMTIEMAYIMSVIFLVFFLSVTGIFYYHDKNIISSCAYETAVVGSVKAREKDGIEEEALNAAFQERIDGKCILFAGAQAQISVEEDEIAVAATARKGKMKVFVRQLARVTEPEKYIRDVRRVKGIIER